MANRTERQIANATITRVTCRWDDQPGVEPGWYCMAWEGEAEVCDSQKVWFPIDVEDYARDESQSLAEALRESFPGALIECDH